MIKLKYKDYRIKENEFGVKADLIYTDRLKADGSEMVKTRVGYYPNFNLAIKAVIKHIINHDSTSQIEDLTHMREMYMDLITDFDDKVVKICERLELDLEKVLEEINLLIRTNDFPLSVLEDVEKRLLDRREVDYAKQQLRYLKKIAARIEEESK